MRWLIVVLCVCGCAQKRAVPDARGERITERLVMGPQGREKLREFDINGDGKPEIWEYWLPATVPDAKAEKISRKAFDNNADGKVDLERHYDESGAISKEIYDLDFDGKVDQTNYYEKGTLVRKERDLSSAGKPNLVLYYEQGKLARKERDSNGDGRVDYWEYWESDHVDRIGEDLDGDGKVDRWTQSPNPGASE